MKEINITSFWDKIKDYKPRDFLKEILEYIDGDSPLEGNILCLGGLEGTGKRTLMMQALEACKFKNEECLFLEAENGDDLWKLYFELDDLLKIRDIKVIFIDEITRTTFFENANILCALAIKHKLRVVVTGNNPGLLLTTRNNIYDKFKYMYDADPTNEIEWWEKFHYLFIDNMTYAEYCRCFNPTSIGNYAKNDGLMKKDLATYYNYCNAKTYVENNIASKIAYEPNTDQDDWIPLTTSFYPEDEWRRAVEKICGLLCGSVERVENCESSSCEFKVKTPSYVVLDSKTSTENKTILEPFAEILTASIPESRDVSPSFVNDVLQGLRYSSFFNELRTVIFVQSSEDGCWNQRIKREYHVMQNFIRYQYLMKNAERFGSVISDALAEIIKAEMVKKTVFFDTDKTLGSKDYTFLKVSFMEKDYDVDNSESDSHIIDMIVYDRNKKHHWAFSVSFGELKADTETLIDPELTKVTEDVYGPRVGNYVLYDDKDYISDEGIHFMNIERFLLKLDELKNMDDTLETVA